MTSSPTFPSLLLVPTLALGRGFGHYALRLRDCEVRSVLQRLQLLPAQRQGPKSCVLIALLPELFLPASLGNFLTFLKPRG